jgi:DNA adenine methylase
MPAKLPHPVPYQGSKRMLAPRIGAHVPRDVEVWFEPFAGSAAMTLWALDARVARHYVIADVLAPIAGLWQAIMDSPTATARRYDEIWRGQQQGNRDYFDAVRARFNAEGDPVDLLYLICRCVKNAVRFNAGGQFTQSVDRRRLGMRPERMAAAIASASHLMRGRTEVRTGDWLSTTADAGRRDFVYLDPPYLGTTIGRDRRYVRQLQQADLIEGLESLLARGVRFMLSYDGMTGAKSYGAPLPEALGLARLLLDAGTSAQATLSGRTERTVESLYLSPGLKPPGVPCSAPRELGGPSS